MILTDIGILSLISDDQSPCMVFLAATLAWLGARVVIVILNVFYFVVI